MTASQRRKRLGQHFLIDPQVIDSIVALIRPRSNQSMVEIGPGPGALTHHLVRSQVKLHAIEIDPQLVKQLRSEFSTDVLSLHHADVLRFDFASIQLNSNKLRIVGNLPYSVSTPLLIRLSKYTDIIEDMCFMVQYEVAARLTAECSSKNYGRLTVMMARNFSIESVFDVEPDAFSPPPQVRSSMIVMYPKTVQSRDPICERVFSELVRLAFGNRRKTLRNSLGSLVGETVFQKAGVDPNLRAQNLSVKHYIELARCVISGASDDLEKLLNRHD